MPKPTVTKYAWSPVDLADALGVDAAVVEDWIARGLVEWFSLDGVLDVKSKRFIPRREALAILDGRHPVCELRLRTDGVV